MIKYPKSNIWNKSRSQWNYSDKKEFELMQSGTIIVKKKRSEPHNSLKVIRIADGKIYPSISECRRSNQFHKIQMDSLILTGVEYKNI